MKQNESYEDAKYSFEWSVEDSSEEVNMGHQESRDGDKTEGSYYVLLPDSRLMKVTYYVDGDSGFVANIEYEGSAEGGDFEGGDNEGGYEKK